MTIRTQDKNEDDGQSYSNGKLFFEILVSFFDFGTICSPKGKIRPLINFVKKILLHVFQNQVLFVYQVFKSIYAVPFALELGIICLNLLSLWSSTI